MSENKYDVVVVGGGMGGLSAACTLLKGGKRVLVLEKHNLPGGCATSFVRGRFEIEATLHEFCSMGQGDYEGTVRRLFDEYGLDVEWVSIDEAFGSVVREPEKGFRVSMPTGVDAFIDEMERQVPGSHLSMEQLMEISRMVYDGVNWLDARHNEPEGLDKVQMLLKYGDLMKLVPVTVEEMLDRLHVPEKARRIYESYWDYISADSSRMSFAVYAYMTYAYLVQKPHIARHRSHEISLAFDQQIRSLGGEIWYNAEVDRINIDNGEIKGVTLKNGKVVECGWVISNLMPNVVFDRMVDEKEVPLRDRKAMNARELGQCCFTLYLGLDASADELGIEGYDVFVREHADPRQQFTDAGSLQTHHDYCYTVISNVIADAYESGSCVLQFSKFFTEDVMKDVRPEDYFKWKEDVADTLIADFEKDFGIRIRGHIEEVVTAAPATWARYLGTPGGDVYGYVPQTWDGMFPRVQSGHHEDHTIKGLRFVGGHGTQMDGYSQACLSGAEQGRYMLEDMKGV